jgi:hypothetical protein
MTAATHRRPHNGKAGQRQFRKFHAALCRSSGISGAGLYRAALLSLNNAISRSALALSMAMFMPPLPRL